MTTFDISPDELLALNRRPEERLIPAPSGSSTGEVLSSASNAELPALVTFAKMLNRAKAGTPPEPYLIERLQRQLGEL